MERRRFLLASALAVPVLVLRKAGADGATRGIDAERVEHALGGASAADERVAAAVEAGIAGARRLDDVSGPRVAVGPALAQREVIHTLLEGGPSGVAQARLTVAAGELSQFLGWVAFAMNDSATALGYFDESLGIAHETGDHNLGSYVLGRRAMLEVAEGRPQQGVAFAEAARSWAETKGSPGTRSWLAGREAEALAKIGDRRGAERALDRARKELARSKPQDEPPWLYFYEEAVLGYWDGSVYVTLGLAEPARRALQRAIATVDPSMVRDQADYLGLLAQTYLLDAEVDEACRLAGEALTVATATRCDRAVVRIWELRGQLERWEPEATVRDLDDQLAATSTWCRQATA